VPSGPTTVTEDPPTPGIDATTSEGSVFDTASGGEAPKLTDEPAPLAAPLADVASTPVEDSSPLVPSVEVILVPAAEQPALPAARLADFFGRAPVLHDVRAAFDRVVAPDLRDLLRWTQTLRCAVRVVRRACVRVVTALVCVRGATEQVFRCAAAGEPANASSAVAMIATPARMTSPRLRSMWSSFRSRSPE
jgi:hypothetical protein